MSSLAEQSAERKNKLQQLRKRKFAVLEEDNEPKKTADEKSFQGIDENDVKTEEGESEKKSEPKQRRKLVSRNYDQNTQLPVNAFDPNSLVLKISDTQALEVVSLETEAELLQNLSKKYLLEETYEDNVVDKRHTEKFQAVKDLQLDLKEQEAILDKKTNKMIRHFLREKLKKGA